MIGRLSERLHRPARAGVGTFEELFRGLDLPNLAIKSEAPAAPVQRGRLFTNK